jgi:hypothetical protein
MILIMSTSRKKMMKILAMTSRGTVLGPPTISRWTMVGLLTMGI